MGNYRNYEFIMVFFTYFLNIDISVTIQVINLKIAMCVLKYPVEGSVSQFFFF